MDFYQTVEKRRSSRKFTSKDVPRDVMIRAFEAAIKAPNSSNMQTWDFYWVKSENNKKNLVKYCLGQSAAREAKELVVVIADPKLWKRSNPEVIKYTDEVKAPKLVKTYYQKLIPFTYRWGVLNCFAPFKWAMNSLVGMFRPTVRGPYTKRDLQEIGIKSAALACENFVLSLETEGFSSCMMEGHDEKRIKKMLRVRGSARTVMVIGVGEPSERALWGHRFRLPLESVLHER
jgi:nitroreductase